MRPGLNMWKVLAEALVLSYSTDFVLFGPISKKIPGNLKVDDT